MKSHSKKIDPDTGNTVADIDDVHLTATQVRRRYGDVSDMALWNWLHDEEIKFPQPMIIGNRRYWKLSSLLAFERRRASEKIEFSDKHISKQRRQAREKSAAKAGAQS